MNRKKFNKHGSITANLSRDILALNVGDRLPTIIEYIEKFTVSRGIVQNAISLLEEEGCVSLSRNGKLGTVITGIDYAKLCKHSGWDPIVGAMPIPFNDSFRSLASALYFDSRKLPVESAIAYVSGAGNRLKMLSKEFFDYIVTSKATAGYIIAENENIELLLDLPDCLYEEPYCLVFMNNKNTEILDGMKVGVDPEAIDQVQISKAMCKGKAVEFVTMPLEGTMETIYSRSVDCMITRREKWLVENTEMVPLPISVTDYPVKDTTIPAVLINKNNYGINTLLKRYLSPERIAEEQKRASAIHSNYRF
ncbi:MAG: YhfZ family protein [Oscillospiraceae bacterium]|nr:YhfZ family protein [Oscillospiraceae bacterium]